MRQNLSLRRQADRHERRESFHCVHLGLIDECDSSGYRDEACVRQPSIVIKGRGLCFESSCGEHRRTIEQPQPDVGSTTSWLVSSPSSRGRKKWRFANPNQCYGAEHGNQAERTKPVGCHRLAVDGLRVALEVEELIAVGAALLPETLLRGRC